MQGVGDARAAMTAGDKPESRHVLQWRRCNLAETSMGRDVSGSDPRHSRPTPTAARIPIVSSARPSSRFMSLSPAYADASAKPHRSVMTRRAVSHEIFHRRETLLMDGRGEPSG